MDKQRFRNTAAEILIHLFQLSDPHHLVNKRILDHMQDEDVRFLTA